MSPRQILLAIPEQWNKLSEDGLFVEYLRDKGFDVVTAFSYNVALEIVQTQSLSAVVMASDWAMKQDDGSPGLIELLKDKIPSFSLITKDTYQKYGYQWFDELYNRPQHEYQSMPVDIDTIAVWLNQIIRNNE